MADARIADLEQLLDLFGRQETAIAELVHLALREQKALIHSDYAAIHEISDQMLAVAATIDRLDGERAELTSRLGNPESLDELLPLADSLGIEGFGEARERLLSEATDLRRAQEQNASLILNAVRLRERWLALVAGMAAPTYGAAGQQELHRGRGLMSRSA